ncbi:MAG: hypothetical protein K6A42_07465 [Treponema sp.]|nr:hypothetical protein [Treponema sp.]
MKKIKRLILLAALFTATPLLSATPSFSGAIGGCAGLNANIPLKGGNSDFKVPLAGFAAIQGNITDWFSVRGEIAADATNFKFDDIFSSSTAGIRLNELSAVLIRRSVTASSFFSGFLGSYEQIGSDAFLMRQFGIDPFSSHLSKSPVYLSGIPTLRTKGAGISYIVNMDKAPIATGAYLYMGRNADNDWTLNIDARFAFVSNLMNLDLLLGIGSPLQDTYNNEDVVLMIDTITLKGGINMLLGSKFTHSLLLQFGMKDVVVKGNSAGIINGDELNFLVEPRIKFRKFRMHFTLYAYDADTLGDLIYLQNELGVAVTAFKDDIETRNGFLTVGIHVIGGIGGVKALKFIEGSQTSDATYNAYITPYVQIPISQGSSVEAMTQIGVCNLTEDASLNIKFILSAKKTF